MADDEQWLTDEESLAWRSVLAIGLLLPGTLDAQLQRESGLTLYEYLVLSYLSMAPERRMRMSALAEMTNGSLSRLSNVVKRLERQGWVAREPDPADGRYTLALLTESGWDVVVAAAPGHVAAVRRYVIDPLTAEHQRAVTEAGARIQERLRSSR